MPQTARGAASPGLRSCSPAAAAACAARSRLRWAVVAGIVLAGSSWLQAPRATAQQPEPANLPNEYTVKAVFLYTFGRYVEWPETALAKTPDTFVIGVLGEDPFGGALDEIAAKKTIQGRRIVVRRFASADKFREPCHILFVSRSLKADQQLAAIKKTEGKGVFVVGENPGFAEQGGIANFFVDGDSVRFEINGDAARRAQLHMDAKLLNLGKPVGTPRPPPTN